MVMILNSEFRHKFHWYVTDVQKQQQLLTWSIELLSFLLVEKNLRLSLKSTLVPLIKIFQCEKEDGLSNILSLSVNKLSVKNWLL